MMKRVCALVLGVLPACCMAWGSGWYLGGGVGADTIDFYQTAYVKKPGDFNVTNKAQLAAQGIFGTAFVGYSWTRCMYYLAAEVNGNASGAEYKGSNKETIHRTFSDTTMSINPAWGVSVLPGIMLPAETLIYARVGYAGGRFEIDTTDTSLKNVDEVLSGVRYGLGIEKNIYKKVSMRFEYNHIHYQDNDIYTLDTTSNVSKKTITSPQTNQFEFGLVYRFC